MTAERTDDVIAIRRPSARGGRVVAATAFAAGVVAATQTMSIPLLPYVVDEWGVDRATASWVATGTLLSSAVASPIVGRLGDLVPKRPLVIGSLLVGLAGSLAGMFATSLGPLVLARVVQGFSSGLIPLSFAVVRDHLPPDRVGRASAVIMVAGAGVGVGLGPVIAGVALEQGGLFAAFGIVAALFAVSVAALWRPVAAAARTGPRPTIGFDVVGSVGGAVVLVALLLGITKGATWGWTSPATLGAFVVAAVGGLIWLGWEHRVAVPVVDLGMLRRRLVALAHAGGAVAGLGTFTVAITVVTLTSVPAGTGHGLGRSLLVAGLVQLPGSLLLSLSVLTTAALASRFDPRWLLAGGATVSAGGFALLAVHHGSLAHLVVDVLVVDLGLGAIFATTPLLLLRGVALEETAAANAVNALARLTGSVVGSAVVSTILASSTVVFAGLTYPSEGAFIAVGWSAAAVAAVLAMTAARSTR